MYSIEDLLIEFMPFFCVPICVALFSTIIKIIIRIIIDIAKGNIEIGERKTERKENIIDLKKKENIIDLKKINIDEDLQKYFNYKE